MQRLSTITHPSSAKNSRSSSKKSRLTGNSNLSVATSASSEESKSQLSEQERRGTLNPVAIMKMIGPNTKNAPTQPKELSPEDLERQMLANLAASDAKARSAAERAERAQENMQATFIGLQSDITTLTEHQQKHSRAVDALTRQILREIQNEL